jgi:hypothetical protein
LSCMLLLYIWNIEKRSFYPIGNGEYITVWKKSGGNCYIIPDKYYGLLSPSGDYIKTTNNNLLEFFWTNAMPKTMIYWKNKEGEPLEVVNNKKDIRFVEYTGVKDTLHSVLYKPNAKLASDVKDGTSMLSLDTKENYARDKAGKKL